MIAEQKSPLTIGAVTYDAFLLVGLIPLSVYVYGYLAEFSGDLFFWACIFTALGFTGIGFLKSYVTETPRWKGVLETLILGALAASVSYLVGDILEKMIT